MTNEELENWFKNAPKPDMPVYLNPSEKVTDYDLFISSHFIGLKNNSNIAVTQPLLDRLLQMKLIIESNL